MSTLKADAITSASSNTDVVITGAGSGVPDIEASFKVGGSAGVPTASIQDDAVTLAKMATGVDGVVITYDASGNPVHVGPGTDGQVLTSTGAGSPPAFEAVSVNNGNWSGTDLSVANGGTGASTFASNNVLLGNGTSALQVVAPSTSGNILTSNGSTWQSTAAASAGMTMGTEVATTSGNNVTFGSIPAGTKMIVLGLDAVSSNSSGILIVQLGDSGGLETSGYLSVASRAINANVSYTSGSTAHFSLQNSNDGAGITHSGSVIFTLQDSTNHCWTMFGTMSCPASSNRQNTCAGRKQLSGELTQLKFFNASGSFNAGSVNITYM